MTLPERLPNEARRRAAMLALLDDPDPTVRGEVERALEEEGVEVADALRAVAVGENPHAAAQAGAVLRGIGVGEFLKAMEPLLRRESTDPLEEGALALCQLHTPGLDPAPVVAELDALAAELALQLEGAENGFGAMREFNRFLLDVERFSPCGQARHEYYDPENSYLHRVLARRVSIPVGLGLIYLLLARRLAVPLFGVNFPAHFLLFYNDGARSFYLDPFNDGQFLTEPECRATLRGLGMEERPEYLAPASDLRVLARMMRNLTAIYREGWPRAAQVLNETIVKLEARAGGV